MSEIKNIGKKAKDVSKEIANISTNQKNKALEKACSILKSNKDEILKANQKDIDFAKENGITGALIDRLTLNDERIDEMANGLLEISKLDDPIGEVINMKKIPNGLSVGKKRVPIGVIGIIYEARPNVTVDGFGLSLKSGNAVILKGGKEAINSNIAIINLIRKSLKDSGIPEDVVQLIESTDRESTTELMRMNEYLDVLIPRGGKGLIRAIVENATVPVIETGAGNCHIFVDESANLDNAIKIIENAKAQRPGVCNAVEHILIHENIIDKIAKPLFDILNKNNVEVRGDEYFKSLVDEAILATKEDWSTEYLDYIISIKKVKDCDEAIKHINEYSTKHSESILTENYENSQKFLERVDSAAVYVNASTRFTDGSQFGFGAEIGISTQKLHARGPMGLKELTTTKYIIYGNGQIRN